MSKYTEQTTEKLMAETVDMCTLSPLTLAFVGDGVYSLMVRQRLACQANRPSGDLHKRSVELVCASAQAQAADQLLPLLTPEEAAVFRRGRNAHTARNSPEYHKSTALEALFGHLYLDGQHERLRELFELALMGQRG